MSSRVRSRLGHFGTKISAAARGAAGGLLADVTGLATLYWIKAAVCATFALTAVVYMPQAHVTRRTEDRHAGSRRPYLLDEVSGHLNLSIASPAHAASCTR